MSIDIDTVILGAGPAGVSASIYAARKKLDFLLISKDIGGQVLTAGDIENYMGFKNIDGISFVEKLIDQLKFQNVNTINAEVLSVDKISEDRFSILLSNGDRVYSKRVLICTGADHKKLNVEGENELTGFGVSYCYTCDAPFFKDKTVVVVGGGNSGLEAAEQLINYAKSITIIEYSNKLNADKVLLDKVLINPKVKVLLNHKVVKINGDKKSGVKSVLVQDMKEDKLYEIFTEGVFVEIGTKPNTEIFVPLGIRMNAYGEIIIDQNNRTSIPYIYAAGDCTNIFSKQIISAAGEGAKALLSLYHDIIFGISSKL